MINVEITNEQDALPIDPARLEAAVRLILEEQLVSDAEISVAVVDDATIRRLNRQYLDHDDTTDVLSFPLEQSAERLEGEVVVSAQTAAAAAGRFGWSAADELLLYVIHGTLHLVGVGDTTPREQAEMRARERACLDRFGLKPHW